MKLIVKMKFGSTVYGTSTPESDIDYKAVYLPDSKDIVLQQVKNVIQHSTGNNLSKNTKDDIDTEIFSLQKYLQLLSEGQTVALDMLFVPDDQIIESSPIWDQIRKNKNKFLSSQYNSFVGYCLTQASKYGIKGSRMAAVKSALNYLSAYESKLRLSEVFDDMGKTLQNIEFIVFHPANEKNMRMLEVNNRKFQVNMKIKDVVDNLQIIYNKYGERAKMAESGQGIDWKALMHAVRICAQAEELFRTHNITFPRPDAVELLKIRTGQVPYSEVQSIIEKGLERLEEAKNASTLPSSPDYDFISHFIYTEYLESIYEDTY